ncbi:hypothetical protein BVRB_038070, partial [Beta vulgaris subsp. vulgaris]
CSGTYGYTILVTHLKSYGKGLFNVDTGWAHFPVKYLALVFRPFRNEVLPAEVFAVNQSGVFARAGPLEIFVSQLCMPPDMQFDSGSESPAFVSADQELRI